MNAASQKSPRLQRVLRVLKDGKPHTTREIVRRANVMAVNACIAELRDLGARISCAQRAVNGRKVWFYTMTEAPKNGR